MSDWVLDLDDFKRHLNYTRPTAGDDDELRLVASLGVAKVEELCGHILAATVVEVVRGSGYALPLDFRAESLTAINGGPVADYRADGQVLSRENSRWISGPVEVTYTAGWPVAPGWAVFAARLIAAQIWKTQLRPNPNNPIPAGFLVPRMATELMTDHLLAPGGFA